MAIPWKKETVFTKEDLAQMYQQHPSDQPHIEGPSADEELGRIAFEANELEAFRACSAGAKAVAGRKTVSSPPPPTRISWDRLPPNVKQRWIRVAEAVLGYSRHKHDRAMAKRRMVMDSFDALPDRARFNP